MPYRRHRSKGRKSHKKRAVKRTSTRDLAKRNHAKLSKLDSQSETKYLDGGAADVYINNINAVTPTTIVQVQNLTAIPTLTGVAAGQAIGSSNARTGRMVYLSAVYAKVCFYYPFENTINLILPNLASNVQTDHLNNTPNAAFVNPVTTINYCFFRQKTNEGATTHPNTPVLPDINDVFNADFQGVVGEKGQNCLFLDMSNGKSFHIVKRGRVKLNALSANMAQTPGLGTLGAQTGALSWIPTQNSGTSEHTMDFAYHPKCCAQYLEEREAAAPVATANIALRNGVYFACWADKTSALGSLVLMPRYTISWRTRFRDRE